VKKDKLWWYGAYRRTNTGQRYPTLVDDVQDTGWRSPPASDYNITGAQKIVGFYQHANKNQPDYLGAIQIAGGRATPAIMHADTVWQSRFPTNVWKVEYNSVLSNALLLELRVAPTSRCGRGSARARRPESRISATISSPAASTASTTTDIAHR